jgi:hypothetical protein
MTRMCFGRALTWMFLLSCAALLGPACGSPGAVGTPGGGNGGSGGGGVGPGSGGAGGVFITVPAQGGAGGAPIDGGAAFDGGPPTVSCGNTTMTPNREQVDVFIVLDRSGSMYYSIAEDCYCAASIGGGPTSPLCASALTCTNRWDAVGSALSLTMGNMTTINWGLELYPTPNAVNSCTVSGSPQVLLGAADSASAVQAAILRGAPSGNTPTAAAITAAAAYVPTVADGYKKAILLATDGAPNCNAAGPLPNNIADLDATLVAIAATYALGIPVYVVGIGPSVGNLDSMAQAGGTGGYYPATSPKMLSDALSAISKIVATTCTFETPMAPPDNSKVWVYVDKTLVAESAADGGAADGWTFGATNSTIVLTGSYCDDMLAGRTTNVQVIFGCPDEPPPAVIP